MTPSGTLRRLVVALALLPQLLLLGFGGVVCIAPDGHVQVEIARSACCNGATPQLATRGEQRVAAADEPGCGPCADVPIVLDSRIGRAGSGVDPLAAGPVAVLDARPAARGARRPWDRSGGGAPPPHLAHLRSVVQRC